MGNRNTNRNVAIVRDVAKSMGATVLEVKNSFKHHGIRIRTKDGVVFWMRVSMGYIEPYKQKGWTRQAINRAVHRREHEKQLAGRRG